MEWHYYNNDGNDCDPCNGEMCFLELQDGRFVIDKQSFGEWNYDDVRRWAHYDADLFSKIFKHFVEQGSLLTKVYLLTNGTGEDGNEWDVNSIHATKPGAEKAKEYYERKQYRDNGSWYCHESQIEEWDVEE